MIRRRTATALDPWLADGLASEMPALVNFANGLQRERSARQGALILPDSNGQVEGQITKLKLLKRPSYGRAQLDRRHRGLQALVGAAPQQRGGAQHPFHGGRDVARHVALPAARRPPKGR